MRANTILSDYIFRADANLLFNPNTGVQHSLNETAAIIIKQLLEGKSKEAVAQFLSEVYNILVGEAMQDIDDLLTEFLSPSETIRFFEFEKALTTVPEFPFALEVELTKLCNWNCGFCYNVWKIDKNGYPKQGVIKHFDSQRLFEILDECKKFGLLRIRYSGGEPTLHPDFQTILDYGANLGLYQVVFSNGHSLSQSTARSWLQSNVKEVLLSLHGPEAVHNRLTGKRDAYRSVIDAIHNCLEVGLGVVVEMVLTRENAGDVLNTIAIVKSMGVEQFRVMRYVPRGENDRDSIVSYETVIQLLAQLESTYSQKDIQIRFPCSQRFCLSDHQEPIINENIVEYRSKYLVQHCLAGINWLSISYDGKLRVCPHSSVYLADISERGKSVRDAWNINVKQPVIRVMNDQNSGCSKCVAMDACRGGCYLGRFLQVSSS